MFSERQSVLKKVKDDLKALVENDTVVAKLHKHADDFVGMHDLSVEERDTKYCRNLLKWYIDSLQVTLATVLLMHPLYRACMSYLTLLLYQGIKKILHSMVQAT